MTMTAPSPAVRAAPARRHRRRRRWPRRAAAIALVVVVLATSWCVVVSRRPGNESFVAKSADWFRDHDLGPVANWVETMYYDHTAPGAGGAPARAIPGPIAVQPAGATGGASAGATGGPSGGASLPPAVVSPASPPLPNEGVWEPAVTAPDGRVAIATAQLRPDATHTSVLGALVWMNPAVLRLVEVPGTVEPGGSWPVVGTVGGPDRPAMVAAFNGGFRFKDAQGGFFAEGQVARPLVDGAASLVIRTDGTVDVGQWGRDDSLGPNVSAVSQNLVLIVDHGAPTPDLNTSDTRRWGRSLRNRVLVWRSGVGVRPDGTLVYAASNGLTVSTLADMLLRAGCVRAMELDINPEWVTYNLFTHPDPANPDTITGQKLLPDMARSADRYLGPDSRDFTAVLLR